MLVKVGFRLDIIVVWVKILTCSLLEDISSSVVAWCHYEPNYEGLLGYKRGKMAKMYLNQNAKPLVLNGTSAW